MADIVLAYSRRSKAKVAVLRNALSKRHSIWWDEQINDGDYRAEIERQLLKARCVVPVWCRTSRSDADVIDEAQFALKRKVSLLPVRIEDVDPPLGLGGLNTADLTGWNGDEQHAGFQELLRNLTAVLTRRVDALHVGSGLFTTPIFFRSVSSYETQLSPSDSVRALRIFGTEPLLVSAYDMAHEENSPQIVNDLDQHSTNGGTILLDSGNYEASRRRDGNWTADKLERVLSDTPHDLAFCFDDLEPPTGIDDLIRQVVAAVERDSHFTRRPVLPIVHVPQHGGGVDMAFIADALSRVVQELRPMLVAIPERELGRGILERARTVSFIRKRLNDIGSYQPLHLLGTGNPLSIAILAAAGADSFDGLEWCRTIADQQTGLLYHFHQYDFFSWQSGLSSAVVKEAVASEGVEFAGKAIFHNLEFFATWMQELQEHVRNSTMDRFLVDKLPGGRETVKVIESAIPGVFE